MGLDYEKKISNSMRLETDQYFIDIMKINESTNVNVTFYDRDTRSIKVFLEFSYSDIKDLLSEIDNFINE